MKKYFRTYWPFALNEIKRNLAYRGSFYLFIVVRLFSVFINYYLWVAVFASSNSGLIGGFTQNEMIVYVFISYIVSNIAMIDVAQDIGEHVVDGTIASNLIKPINYRSSIVFQAFGTAVYRFLIPSIFIWIALEIYKVTSLGMSFVNIYTALLFLISCFMSFLIFVLFDFCFGLLAFFTTYLFGLLMVESAVLSILTGQLIPLNLFPEIFQKVFEFLPFSSMIFVPTMIYLDKYSTGEMIFVLARQAVWVVLLYILGSILWKQVMKKVVVLGG